MIDLSRLVGRIYVATARDYKTERFPGKKKVAPVSETEDGKFRDYDSENERKHAKQEQRHVGRCLDVTI